MLDELQGPTGSAGGTRKQQREIEAAVHCVEQRLAAPAQESEIAAEMGLSLSAYQTC